MEIEKLFISSMGEIVEFYIWIRLNVSLKLAKIEKMDVG